MENEIELMRQRLHRFYQRNKRTLMTLELKLIKTPTQELETACAEARGVLKGIQKSIGALGERANDHEFPGLGV